MEEMYGLNSTSDYSDKVFMSPENLILPADYQSFFSSSVAFRDNRSPVFGSNELISVASAMSETASITPEIQREEDMSSVIKAKIASHPGYPRLLEAYIDCQKVNLLFNDDWSEDEANWDVVSSWVVSSVFSFSHSNSTFPSFACGSWNLWRSQVCFEHWIMYSDGAVHLVIRFRLNELYIILITPIWSYYFAFMASMADLLFWLSFLLWRSKPFSVFLEKKSL